MHATPDYIGILQALTDANPRAFVVVGGCEYKLERVRRAHYAIKLLYSPEPPVNCDSVSEANAYLRTLPTRKAVAS